MILSWLRKYARKHNRDLKWLEKVKEKLTKSRMKGCRWWKETQEITKRLYCLYLQHCKASMPKCLKFKQRNDHHELFCYDIFCAWLFLCSSTSPTRTTCSCEETKTITKYTSRQWTKIYQIWPVLRPHT